MDEKQARRYARQDKRLRDAAVEALLQNEAGRKYLWWLLEVGWVGQQPFAQNALVTSFNCGQLNVGQQILNHILEVNPAGYVQMQKESQDEWSRRTSADAGANGDDDAPSDY